jgi:hypothetical protein
MAAIETAREPTICETMALIKSATGAQDQAAQPNHWESLEQLTHARLENELIRLTAENALLRLQDHSDLTVAVRADHLLDVLSDKRPDTDWASWALDLQNLQREGEAL